MSVGCHFPAFNGSLFLIVTGARQPAGPTKPFLAVLVGPHRTFIILYLSLWGSLGLIGGCFCLTTWQLITIPPGFPHWTRKVCLGLLQPVSATTATIGLSVIEWHTFHGAKCCFLRNHAGIKIWPPLYRSTSSIGLQHPWWIICQVNFR